MLDFMKTINFGKCDNHWLILKEVFFKKVYTLILQIRRKNRVNQSFTKLLRVEMTKLMKPELRNKGIKDFVKEDFLVGIDNNAKLKILIL